MYLSCHGVTDLAPRIAEYPGGVRIEFDIAGNGQRGIALHIAKELDRQQIIRLLNRLHERLDAELIRFLEDKEAAAKA